MRGGDRAITGWIFSTNAVRERTERITVHDRNKSTSRNRDLLFKHLNGRPDGGELFQIDGTGQSNTFR